MEDTTATLLNEKDVIHIGKKCTCGNLMKVVYSETSYQLACLQGCQLILGPRQIKAALSSTPETRRITWKVRPRRVLCSGCYRVKFLYRFKKY